MKTRRKIKLKYKKDRVLLSDVLPYELPIIMSNRMLYRFCVKYKIRYNVQSNKLWWDKNMDSDAFEVLKLIFKPALRTIPNLVDGEAKQLSPFSSIPFVFHIFHKESEFRSLSLVHPAMQIGMVDFYNEYKHLIIHYCNKSQYSLRYPNKVASFYYYKDKLHHKLLGTKRDKIELFFNEYENLKTFFSYKKYNQIYKFYDDYRFQRAEKRFQNLLRFDIQKCFDSIYTHTIAWATQGGKSIYKKSFGHSDSSSFGGIFDTVMQRLNYNETSGIVIGPEFSRIFAEIILQYIDSCVERSTSKANLRNGFDYQLYRYVDDYFLFYNEDIVKHRIIELFNRHFEDYRLKISREKTIGYERPFITRISRAKIRIDHIIDDWFKFRSSESVNGLHDDSKDDEKDIQEDNIEDENGFILDLEKLDKYLNINGYYPLVSRKFNQEFKDAILSVDVQAKDVLNYTLSCVGTRVDRELKKFGERYKYIKLASLCTCAEMTEDLRTSCKETMASMERKLTKYLIDVIDSAFFLFALNKRLNATLKLSRLLNLVIIFLNGVIQCKDKTYKRFDNNVRIPVFNQIHNEVVNVLMHSRCHEYAQLEILYLLIIMRSISTTNPISENILMTNLGMDKSGEKVRFNAIAINVLLYYVGNKKRYKNLKSRLVDMIMQKLREKEVKHYCQDSETVIMMLDLACCPYIEDATKKAIFVEMKLAGSEINGLLSFAKKNKHFFTKWSGVDITKELAAKVSQEVYT